MGIILKNIHNFVHLLGNICIQNVYIKCLHKIKEYPSFAKIKFPLIFTQTPCFLHFHSDFSQIFFTSVFW